MLPKYLMQDELPRFFTWNSILTTEVIAMHRSEKSLATLSPLPEPRAGTDVEQRRRVIVALLQQHQDGLTAREIREATGLSKTLTESALSGLFTRSIVHKRGNRYVLTA
jgi:hypothetical protein